MGKFNLKKAEKTVKPYEKLLIDDNNERGLAGDADKPYEKLLEDTRKPKDSKGDKNYEKLLEKKREDSPSVNTEKQLDAAKSYIPFRDDNPTPVMDMYKKTEDESAKEFKKETKAGDRDTMFWDKFLHDQTPADQLTKIVDNDQGSQLLSNFDTRENFRKDNSSVGKEQTGKGTRSAMELVKDADAVLFHIYTKASRENRKLTGEEQNTVDAINNEKANILTAAIKTEGQRDTTGNAAIESQSFVRALNTHMLELAHKNPEKAALLAQNQTMYDEELKTAAMRSKAGKVNPAFVEQLMGMKDQLFSMFKQEMQNAQV